MKKVLRRTFGALVVAAISASAFASTPKPLCAGEEECELCWSCKYAGEYSCTPQTGMCEDGWCKKIRVAD